MELMDLYYENKYDELTHGFQLDKFDHLYLQRYYNKEFSDIREKEIKLLEIGVATGISIKFWSEWFINGKIYGVDIGHPSMYTDFYMKNNLHNVYWEDALNDSFLSLFNQNYFDYIIDDGSHWLNDQITAIIKYLPKIKPNGKLIIEDIGNIHNIPNLIDYIDKELSYEWNLYDLRHISGRNYPNSILLEIIRNDKHA